MGNQTDKQSEYTSNLPKFRETDEAVDRLFALYGFDAIDEALSQALWAIGQDRVVLAGLQLRLVEILADGTEDVGVVVYLSGVGGASTTQSDWTVLYHAGFKGSAWTRGRVAPVEGES